MEAGFPHLKKIYAPCNLWHEITNPVELERTIIQGNERHLQQASIEEGRVHDPTMQQLIENHGSNDLVDSLLKGEMSLDEITDEAIQAWLSAVQQTSTNMTLPKIEGAMSVEEFQ